MPADEGLMDTLQLRHALGRFTTGITIVSCIDEAGHFVRPGRPEEITHQAARESGCRFELSLLPASALAESDEFPSWSNSYR